MSFFSSVFICRHFDLCSIGNSETKVIAKIYGYRLLISASPCAIVCEKALRFCAMGQEFGAVASGTWRVVKSKKRKSLASWTDEVTGNTILFEFKKNGRIKIYSDKNGNGKINKRKDILIGQDKFNKSYDKQYYNKDHFMKADRGDFEIEVEGYINDEGIYEAYYSIRLDSGVDEQTDYGSTININKFVDVRDHSQMTSIFQPDI